ncbi:glycosyltransferase [Angustibacter aerolatus]
MTAAGDRPDELDVSVVVATYRSGERLDLALASVAAQTLAPERFEVVVVDDGSGDDTLDRARAFAAAHPRLQVVVDAIEPSGWPGRPRNVGVARARGRFLLFMDHDDHLYPDALSAMTTFGDRHDLDLVLGKEAAAGGATPGWRTWRADVPVVERVDQAVLQCMTPHKLYRRAFWESARVRFPEGRVRLEDYDVNAQVIARGARVGVLASVPCYRWNLRGSASRNDAFDQDVYWASFDHSLLAVEELPDGDLREQLLVRWFASRVLGRAGPRLLRYQPQNRPALLQRLRGTLRHFPPHLDRLLAPADLARATLLRSSVPGVDELLAELAGLDQGTRVVTEPARVRWRDGALSITVEGVLHDGSGAPMDFDRVDDRLLRRLPPGVGTALDALDPAVRDVTQAVEEGAVDLVVRGREDDVEWALPTVGRLQAATDEATGRTHLRVHAEAVLDPADAALGAPLTDQIWSVQLRVDALGFAPVTRLRTPAALPPGVVGDRAVVPYRTDRGNLAVDVGPTRRTVVGSARPGPGDVRTGPDGLSLRLPALHAHGSSAPKPVTLLVGDRELPARLLPAQRTVRSTGPLPPLPPGAHPLEVRVDGRRSRTNLVLDADATGGLHARRAGEPPWAPPVQAPAATLRRAVRVVRRRLGR